MSSSVYEITRSWEKRLPWYISATDEPDVVDTKSLSRPDRAES